MTEQLSANERYVDFLASGDSMTVYRALEFQRDGVSNDLIERAWEVRGCDGAKHVGKIEDSALELNIFNTAYFDMQNDFENDLYYYWEKLVKLTKLEKIYVRGSGWVIENPETFFKNLKNVVEATPNLTHVNLSFEIKEHFRLDKSSTREGFLQDVDAFLAKFEKKSLVDANALDALKLGPEGEGVLIGARQLGKTRFHTNRARALAKLEARKSVFYDERLRGSKEFYESFLGSMQAWQKNDDTADMDLFSWCVYMDLRIDNGFHGGDTTPLEESHANDVFIHIKKTVNGTWVGVSVSGRAEGIVDPTDILNVVLGNFGEDSIERTTDLRYGCIGVDDFDPNLFQYLELEIANLAKPWLGIVLDRSGAVDSWIKNEGFGEHRFARGLDEVEKDWLYNNGDGRTHREVEREFPLSYKPHPFNLHYNALCCDVFIYPDLTEREQVKSYQDQDCGTLGCTNHHRTEATQMMLERIYALEKGLTAANVQDALDEIDATVESTYNGKVICQGCGHFQDDSCKCSPSGRLPIEPFLPFATGTPASLQYKKEFSMTFGKSWKELGIVGKLTAVSMVAIIGFLVFCVAYLKF